MVQFNSGEWGPAMDAVFAKIRESAERIGLEQGIEQGVKNVVVEMLKEGTPIDFIAKVTHLEIDEIEN